MPKLKANIEDQIKQVQNINEELTVVRDSIERMEYVIGTYTSYEGIQFMRPIDNERNVFLLPLDLQMNIQKVCLQWYQKREIELIAQATELLK